MPKYRIELEWDDSTGELHVRGPLENKVVSYGMLELAKEFIARQISGKQGKLFLPTFPKRT